MHCPRLAGAFWFTWTSPSVTPLENHHTNPIPSALTAALHSKSRKNLICSLRLPRQVLRAGAQQVCIMLYNSRQKRNKLNSYFCIKMEEKLCYKLQNNGTETTFTCWELFLSHLCQILTTKKSKHKGKLHSIKTNLKHLSIIHSLLSSPNGLHFQK